MVELNSQLSRAPVSRSCHSVLAAIQVLHPQGAEQIERGLHGLRVLQVAGDDADALRLSRGQPGRHGGKGFTPGRRLQLAVLAHIGPVQPLAGQAIAGVAGLVGDPFLVDLVIGARQHAHHLVGAAVDADRRAQGVHHVDALGLLQLPGPGVEGVGLGGQRADRAEVDDVGRKLAQHRLFQIGGDLHVLAARDQADLGLAGHLGDEADAAGALDAAGHHRLDQRAHELLFDGPLVLGVAAGVAAIAHRLVLEIALAALVADRAIQRVVDQQEFHHPLAGLLDHRGVCENLLVVGRRQGAGRLGLRWAGLHLDQAHAAVAGDRQPLVIAEARNLLPGQLRHLQNRHPGFELDLDAVDLGFRHLAIRQNRLDTIATTPSCSRV